jgi:hypothetical protein
MTRGVIGQGMVTAGLGVLLLAASGMWDEAEADRRHRGRHHHHGFHGGHFHGPRVFIGPRFHVGPRVHPYYSPYYYGGYYYGYAPPVVVTPPPVVVTPPPTTYVERPPTQYWHYCQDPAGYYPDVQQCPGGWVQVPPRSE